MTDASSLRFALENRLDWLTATGVGSWSVGFEVRYASEDGAVIRRADAVALNVETGELHGFEIKVSRADWLNELADPGKAAPTMRYCDRWWLVAPEDGDVVRAGELPATWGLLVLRGHDLVVRTDAPKLSPIPADPRFLIALMKRAHVAVAEELNGARSTWERYLRRVNAATALLSLRPGDRAVRGIEDSLVQLWEASVFNPKNRGPT